MLVTSVLIPGIVIAPVGASSCHERLQSFDTAPAVLESVSHHECRVEVSFTLGAHGKALGIRTESERSCLGILRPVSEIFRAAQFHQGEVQECSYTVDLGRRNAS